MGRESQPAEYTPWANMISRCSNQRNKRFNRYGGRGICVCESWRTSFKAFLADMGPRPSPAHSIERKDNDGNYEPGNCMWATIEEQTRNRSSTRKITFHGRTLCLLDWAAEIGISHASLHGRLRRGWPLDKALTTKRLPPTEHSTNRLIAFRGETLCLTDWARRIGLLPVTLRKRFEAGWTVERALTQGKQVQNHGKP